MGGSQRVRPAHFFVAAWLGRALTITCNSANLTITNELYLIWCYGGRRPPLLIAFTSICLMSSCLIKNVFMSFMQTFAQPNCVFALRSATNI